MSEKSELPLLEKSELPITEASVAPKSSSWRKKVLAVAATLGAVCYLAPPTMFGPPPSHGFFVPGQPIQENLVDNRPGLPLILDVLVVDQQLQPVQGAAVNILHGDASAQELDMCKGLSGMKHKKHGEPKHKKHGKHGDHPRGPPPKDGDHPRGPPPKDGDHPRGPPPKDGDHPRGPPPKDGDEHGPPHDGDERGPPHDGDKPGKHHGPPPPGRHHNETFHGPHGGNSSHHPGKHGKHGKGKHGKGKHGKGKHGKGKHGKGKHGKHAELDDSILTGLGVTDENGVARFTTIFPGSMKIYYRLFVDGATEEGTYLDGFEIQDGEFTFDQDVQSAVRSVAPYSATERMDDEFSDSDVDEDNYVIFTELVDSSIENGVTGKLIIQI